MKDKDSYFRGACNSCNCQEYANDGGIRCGDCRCPASRHKLTYWTSPKVKSTASSAKKYSLAQFNPIYWISFQWLSFFNPWTLINFFISNIPIIGFYWPKKPEPSGNKLMQEIQKIPGMIAESYPKSWADFVAAVPDFSKLPNIDSKLQVVEKFQKRLPLALAALGVISVAGILGFSGSHLNFEILDSLYMTISTLLVIGASFSYHIYLSSKSSLKRTLSIVFFGMNIFSALVYFLLYLGITPKLYGPLGIPIQTARFIDWNLSLSCFLEIASLIITGNPIDGDLDSKVQILILSLLISSGQFTPLCEILGGLGIFIIGTILLDFGTKFESALETRGGNNVPVLYIQKIIFWTLSLIAGTWILGLFQILRFPESELFYSLGDAGFKCGLTAVVLCLEENRN